MVADNTVSSDAEEPSLAPGTVLDEKFRIERLLGMGGMGAVYEVTHTLTHHRRALKLLHGHTAARRATVERFLQEASAAGKIGNPHIVETFDAGRLGSGEPYVVMELLEGQTLGERIATAKGSGLALGEVAAIFVELCDGVQAAHEAGIVHRDLKPDNIFLSHADAGGRVKVLDFGVSKFDERHTALEARTASGAFVGTPAYMSPEQFVDGAVVDSASDVYALGVILYEALTGRHPYPSESILTLARNILEADIAPPSRVVSDLPPALDELLARALERDRDRRGLTAAALASELSALARAAGAPLSRPAASIAPPGGGSPVSQASLEVAPTIASDEVSPLRLADRSARRWLSWTWGALVALAMVGGLLAWLRWRGDVAVVAPAASARASSVARVAPSTSVPALPPPPPVPDSASASAPPSRLPVAPPPPGPASAPSSRLPVAPPPPGPASTSQWAEPGELDD